MRIMTERALVQRIHTKKTREMMVLKGKLRVAERTIEGLKDEADRCGQEVHMLQSKLLVSGAQLSHVDTRLWRMERMAYEIGFNECRALRVQILPSVEGRLLQIFVPTISHAFAILQIGRGRGWGPYDSIYVFAG